MAAARVALLSRASEVSETPQSVRNIDQSSRAHEPPCGPQSPLSSDEEDDIIPMPDMVLARLHDTFIHERNQFIDTAVDAAHMLMERYGEPFLRKGFTERYLRDVDSKTCSYITRIRTMTAPENYPETVATYGGADWWNENVMVLNRAAARLVFQPPLEYFRTVSLKDEAEAIGLEPHLFTNDEDAHLSIFEGGAAFWRGFEVSVMQGYFCVPTEGEEKYLNMLGLRSGQHLNSYYEVATVLKRMHMCEFPEDITLEVTEVTDGDSEISACCYTSSAHNPLADTDDGRYNLPLYYPWLGKIRPGTLKDRA